MSDPIKQHTLPKFYIAGFHAEKRRKRNPKVWYYPLDEPKPRRWRLERAKKISVRPDYYTMSRKPPETRFRLEKGLGLLEEDASRAIGKLSKEEFPTLDELNDIAQFIVSMIGRVPRIVDGLAERIEGHARTQLGQWHERFTKHPEELEEFLREMRERGGPTSSNVEPSWFDPARFRIKPDTGAITAHALKEVVTSLYPGLLRADWTVLITSKDLPFIASDSPVAVVPQARDAAADSNETPTTFSFHEISMPLRSEVALVIRPNLSGEEIIRVGFASATIPGVLHINRRAALAARTFLIACSDAFPGQGEVTNMPAFDTES